MLSLIRAREPWPKVLEEQDEAVLDLSDPVVAHWVAEARRRRDGAAVSPKLVANRRRAHCRRLQATQDDYFSESEMRHRDPKAWHRMVGKFSRSAPSRRQGFDDFMFERLEVMDCRAQAAEADAEDAAMEEETEEEDADPEFFASLAKGEVPSPTQQKPNAAAPEASLGDESTRKRPRESNGAPPFFSSLEEAEKYTAQAEADEAERMAELVDYMVLRFVDGKDADFVDYASIDADAGLNDLEQISRDAEDKYFDSD